MCKELVWQARVVKGLKLPTCRSAQKSCLQDVRLGMAGMHLYICIYNNETQLLHFVAVGESEPIGRGWGSHTMYNCKLYNKIIIMLNK